VRVIRQAVVDRTHDGRFTRAVVQSVQCSVAQSNHSIDIRCGYRLVSCSTETEKLEFTNLVGIPW
jgi:hypothetical protein